MPYVHDIVWCDLLASDAGSAAAWYALRFGWSVDVSSDGTAAFYVCGVRGAEVCSIGASAATPLGHAGWTVYVGVEDITRALVSWGRLGASVLLPPTSIPGQGTLSLVADPWGSRLGLWEADSHPGATTEGLGALCAARHSSPDPASALALYCRVFGWIPDPPAGGTDSGTRLARTPSGLSLVFIAAEPSAWLPAFGATSIDGGAAERIAVACSAERGFSVGLCRDPEGWPFVEYAASLAVR